MKKRILSIVLSIVMLVSLLPTTALAMPSHTDHCVCGAAHISIGDHTDTCEAVEWTAWSGGTITYTNNTASVYLSTNVTLESALTVAANQTLHLCLNGKSITKENGAAITVASGATLNICDCSTATRKGYIDSSSNSWIALEEGNSVPDGAVELDLTGGYIQGRISASGPLNMYGGNIVNSNGVGVTASNDSTFNMYGGTIAGHSGDGVQVGDNTTKGTFNMYGGKIYNKNDGINNYNAYGVVTVSDGIVTSTNDRGIYNNGSGTITVSGGAITGANNGIYNFGGTITVSGGTVSSTNGYGIYNNNILILSGAPEIEGTTADVYLSKNEIIDITGALSYAPENAISVEIHTPGTFTSGWTEQMGKNADYGSYFTSAMGGYTVQPDGSGELKLAEPPAVETHSHPVCGATHSDIGDHTGDCAAVEWTAWDGTTDITYTDGTAYVYLSADVSLSGALVVGANQTLYLCLNDHVLDYNGNDASGAITVKEGGVLYLTDCCTAPTTRYGQWNEENTVYTISTSQPDGGSFDTLTGGVITGGGYSANLSSRTYNGGGVWVYNGTFYMYGGTIAGNTAAGTGGGVWVYNRTFYMYDGTITGNRAANGGGIDVFEGTFYMYGGTIAGNTATGSTGGGGVVLSESEFHMSGGSISNNRAAANGGGVVLSKSSKSKFNMSGGSITGNSADKNGGGVYAPSSAYITVSGAPKIINNTKGAGDSAPANNLVPESYSRFTVSGTLGTGASIGISRTEAGQFSTGGADSVGYFSSDDTTYEVADDGNGNLKLAAKTIAVTGVTLNKSSTSITVGGTEQLTATVLPNNATNKTVAWSSNDGSIVTVDSNGNITAQNVGTATITVSAGGKTATCTVKVNAKALSASNVTLSQDSFAYDGSAKTPTVTVMDGDTVLAEGTDYTVSYSDNTNAGTGKVTVTFTGNYSGSAEKSFTIGKATPVLGTVAVSGTVTDTTAPADVVLTQTGTVAGKFEITDDAMLANKVLYSYTFTPDNTTNYNTVTGTVQIDVKDTQVPSATIKVDTKEWKEKLNGITFGIFFKNSQTVTITYADNENGSGVNEMLYFVADKELTETELAAVEWNTYISDFDINPDGKFVIYAKVSDNDGNDVTVNSNGIVLDETQAVIEGVTNGGIYYGNVTITVSDALAGVKEVKVDGEAVTLSDGKYTIEADNDEHTIVVTDNAGNATTYTVTVYKIYTVTYKADGQVVSSQSVNHGADATAPAIPTKEGYTQTAPYWDGDGKNITTDTEINAVYTINKYTVTYKADGVVVDTQTVEHGKNAAAPAIPTKVGYTQTAPTWDKDGKNITTDTEINAVYTINKYTVTYMADGATISTQTIEHGADATAPAVPTKVGYTQVAPYWDGDGKNITTNTTITAVYTINKYTVTYKADGQVVDTQTIEHGAKIAEPTAPTKDKANFAGWFSDIGCTMVWNFDNDTVTGDLTLYAKWSEVTVFQISGTVKKLTGNSNETTAVRGATVKLMLGDKLIATTTTDGNGNYSFAKQEAGHYNVVVTNGAQTVTVLIELTKDTANEVVLPASVTNSIVDHKPAGNGKNSVAAGTLVGGLEELAAAVREQEEQKITDPNVEIAKVEVTLTVEDTPPVTGTPTAGTEAAKQQAQQKAIQQKVGGKQLVFFDLSVVKSVTNNNNQTTVSRISDTGSLLEIRIPFDSGNKWGITIYRYHGDKAEALAAVREGSTTEGFWVGDDGYIHIYTHKFSTYAVGYTVPSYGYFVPITPDTVTSADTFDAGIVVYVTMSMLAATGSAVVIGKKRKEEN